MERVVEEISTPLPCYVVLCDNVHKTHRMMLDSLATFGGKQLWYASLKCLLLSVLGLYCYECAYMDHSLEQDVSTKMVLTAAGLLSVLVSVRSHYCPKDIKADLGSASKVLPWTMSAIVAWSRGVYGTYLAGHDYLAAAFFLESCVWSQCLTMGMYGCVSRLLGYHHRQVAYWGSGVPLGYPEGRWSQALERFLSLSVRLTKWRVCSAKISDGSMLLLQDALSARSFFETTVNNDYAHAVGGVVSSDHGAGCFEPQTTVCESVPSADFSNFFTVAHQYGMDVLRCARIDECFSKMQGLLEQEQIECEIERFVNFFDWTRAQVVSELNRRNVIAAESMIKQ